MSPELPIPLAVRVPLAHACVQALADELDVDLLHLKGPAVAPGLRTDTAADSSDADVLVRPSHLTPLLDGLAATGWRQLTGFETGSAFKHAANYHHPGYGILDVHRFWPGFEVAPDVAFDLLWAGRTSTTLAGWTCAVPERAAQMIVLATHAARSGRTEAALGDLRTAWHEADARDRTRALALVTELEAAAALVVGLGGPPSGPQADLWRHFSGGGDRLDEWRARWRSARGVRAKARVARGVLLPDRQWYVLVLGHEPTAADLLRIQRARIGRALDQLTGRVMTGRRARDGERTR